MIPSVKKCMRIMEQHKMPSHIMEHSITVAKITSILARALNLSGVPIALDRAVAGALLHDIGKITALLEGGDHCEIGRRICIEEQCPEIADIVLKHVRFASWGIPSDLSEEELVYYADKRVKHDRIVDLDERLEYILERYGRNEAMKDAIRQNFSMCRIVEERIFRPLSFGPDSMAVLAAAEIIETQ